MEAEIRAEHAPPIAELRKTETRDHRVRSASTIFFATLLAALLLHLIIQGYSYYKLPLEQRYRSPLHAEMKPGGHTGRMLGISGSLMMITLLSYSLRKRLRAMRNWGKLSTWLHFHIFLGVAGPLLITFHTAFKLRGIVAISYWSMITVALSGVLGRYLYAQIPHALNGAELQAGEIQKHLEEVNAQLQEWLDPPSFEALQRITTAHVSRGKSLFSAIPIMLKDDIHWILIRRRLVAFARNTPRLSEFQRTTLPVLAQQQRLHQRRILLLKTSQELFRYWHIFHLPLAKTMYLTMVIHVAVAIMTGYFWKS